MFSSGEIARRAGGACPSPSSPDFLLFIVEDLHRHRVRGAANRAQPAADTFLVVFEHGRKRPAPADAVVLHDFFFDSRLQFHLIERHELQAVFWTKVYTAIA